MKVIYLLTFLLLSTLNYGQVDHKALDNLLKQHVDEYGVVKYAALKTKIKDIESIIKQYGQVKLSSLSKDEKLAYYINVYNINTIYKIVSKYPVKSIKDIDKGKPWDVKYITIENKKYSLNEIENILIRPVFKDARIHFALNCGAVSCPALLNEAYTGVKLNKQLDNQTKKFINNKKFNVVDKSKISISKIFEWYKEDFGNVCDFISKYSVIKVDQSATILYLTYDWSLNGK